MESKPGCRTSRALALRRRVLALPRGARCRIVRRGPIRAGMVACFHHTSATPLVTFQTLPGGFGQNVVLGSV
jgi:hypothetical protein